MLATQKHLIGDVGLIVRSKLITVSKDIQMAIANSSTTKK
jgi:hypothetical protein